MRLRVAIAAAAALLVAHSAAAQEVRTAISPDTASVGGLLRVAVRVDLPPGARIAMPDTLPLADPLENASRARERVDTLPGGALRVTSVYPITAWRPGLHQLPGLTLTVQDSLGERALQVALPEFVVRSVLPMDTTDVQPKPAKAVVGRNWVIWPFVVLALLLAALIALGVRRWLRRRANRVPPAVPHAPPRERALAALDAIAASGMTRAADVVPFYAAVSEVLRRFVAETEPANGTELTTSELAARLQRADAAAARPLLRLLYQADLVKFARARPDAGEREAYLRAAREWVASHAPPSASEPALEAA